MIDYELARELKEAGFPQPDEAMGALAENSDRLFCPHPSGQCNCADKDFVFFPTLSELIEACGERTVKLVRWRDGEATAFSRGDQKGFEDERYEHLARGQNPEEAVANLWLALHPSKVVI